MSANSRPASPPRPRQTMHRRRELKEDRDLNRPRYDGPCYQLILTLRSVPLSSRL